jgi:hypothetical protein
MIKMGRTGDRIAALEAEVAALRANRPPAVPSRPAGLDRNRPLVTVLAEETKFVRPTTRELHRIYDVVLGKYPQLGPHKSVKHSWASVSEAEHYAGFASAFERLGFIGRTA